MGRPVVWTPSLATGVDEIDSQHRQLFERANGFLDSLRQPERRGAIAEALAYLASYVRYHFATEEAHMARLGYPGRHQHQEEHRDYVRRLQALQSHFENEGDSAAVYLAIDSMIRTWLVDHVGRVDRHFGEFARASEAIRSQG
jgi:hemerythrin